MNSLREDPAALPSEYELPEYELFVDPACPWSWLAVRWLAEVSREGELALQFRSFSLWLRDGDQQAPGMPPMFRDLAVASSKQSLRLLRVFEALRSEGSANAVGPLYLAWGERVFQPGIPTPPAPTLVDELLTSAGLEQFRAAADDVTWNATVEASMEELRKLTGPTPLVPTLLAGTPRHILFTGAIISAPLTPTAAQNLWTALTLTAVEPAFISITTTKPPMPTFT